MKQLVIKNYLFFLSLGIGLTMIAMWQQIKRAQPINGIVREEGIGLFYDSYAGIAISPIMFMLFYFLLFIPPVLYSSLFIHLRQTHGDYILRMRYTNYSKYLGKIMVKNAIWIYVYYFILELVRIGMIQLCYAPLKFYPQSELLLWSIDHFTTNGWWNFILFVLASPLGYAIFGTLVFVVGLYLKSMVHYIASGFILAITGILLPALLSSFLPISWFLQSLFLENLLTPTLMVFGNTGNYSPVICYLLAVLVYSAITVILFYYRMYLDKKGGY